VGRNQAILSLAMIELASQWPDAHRTSQTLKQAAFDGLSRLYPGATLKAPAVSSTGRVHLQSTAWRRANLLSLLILADIPPRVCSGLPESWKCLLVGVACDASSATGMDLVPRRAIIGMRKVPELTLLLLRMECELTGQLGLP
jgi:hypothetical protein